MAYLTLNVTDIMNAQYSYFADAEQSVTGIENFAESPYPSSDLDFDHFFDGTSMYDYQPRACIPNENIFDDATFSYLDILNQDTHSSSWSESSVNTDMSSVCTENDDPWSFMNPEVLASNVCNVPGVSHHQRSPKISSGIVPSYVLPQVPGMGLPPAESRNFRPQSGTKAVQHSNSEWEDIKPHFIRYYLHEGMDLRAVMYKLARHHNFYATEQMFKRRISRWGAFKKIKRAQKHYSKAYKTTLDQYGPADPRTIKSRLELQQFCRQNQLDAQAVLDQQGEDSNLDEYTSEDDNRTEPESTNIDKGNAIQSDDQSSFQLPMSSVGGGIHSRHTLQRCQNNIHVDDDLQEISESAFLTQSTILPERHLRRIAETEINPTNNRDLQEIPETQFHYRRKNSTVERPNKRPKQQQSHKQPIVLPHRSRHEHVNDDLQEISASTFERHNPPRNERRGPQQIPRASVQSSLRKTATISSQSGCNSARISIHNLCSTTTLVV